MDIENEKFKAVTEQFNRLKENISQIVTIEVLDKDGRVRLYKGEQLLDILDFVGVNGIPFISEERIILSVVLEDESKTELYSIGNLHNEVIINRQHQMNSIYSIMENHHSKEWLEQNKPVNDVWDFLRLNEYYSSISYKPEDYERDSSEEWYSYRFSSEFDKDVNKINQEIEMTASIFASQLKTKLFGSIITDMEKEFAQTNGYSLLSNVSNYFFHEYDQIEYEKTEDGQKRLEEERKTKEERDRQNKEFIEKYKKNLMTNEPIEEPWQDRIARQDQEKRKRAITAFEYFSNKLNLTYPYSLENSNIVK